MSKILTDTIEFRMNNNSHATRTYNSYYPFIEWKINPVSKPFNIEDHTKNYYEESTYYSYFNGDWYKMKPGMSGIRHHYINSDDTHVAWIKCETPDCEKEYQTLLRDNKLKRIMK